MLDVELFLEAPARLKQPIGTVLGDRAALALALRFQGAAALAHPRPAALRACDELPRIELVTGASSSADASRKGVRSRSRRSLASRRPCADPRACAGARAARRRARCRRARPRAGRSPRPPRGSPARSGRSRGWRPSRRWRRSSCRRSPHADPGQPRPRAQPQHAGEHVGQRPLMPAAEVRDRRVIGRDVARHHPERDIIDAGALDPARGPNSARVGVEQQRDHHRRLIGRTAVPVGTVVGVDRRQIKLSHRVEHRPNQMPLRHPVTDRRGHQEHLLTVTTDEPRAHTREGSRCDRAAPPFSDSLRHRRQPAEEPAECGRGNSSPTAFAGGHLTASARHRMVAPAARIPAPVRDVTSHGLASGRLARSLSSREERPWRPP